MFPQFIQEIFFEHYPVVIDNLTSTRRPAMSRSTACLQLEEVSPCIVKYCHLRSNLCHELPSVRRMEMFLVLLFCVQYADIWMNSAAGFCQSFWMQDINVTSKKNNFHEANVALSNI